MSNTWTCLPKLCFLINFCSLSSEKLWGSCVCIPLDQRSKPHLVRNGRRINCNISNYVPFLVLGLSVSSSSSTPSLTSPSCSSKDSLFDVNRYTENVVPERSGSTSEELQGDPLHETTEAENHHKGEPEEVQRDLSHDLPDWLQEFRENL